MEPNLPSIVQDSRLEIEVFADHVVQGRARGKQKWQRTTELGRGSYGVVWLEKCTSGPGSGKVRAVKELWKGQTNVSPVSYSRELEAVAKFSQARYREFFVQSFGWYESNSSVFITMEYLPLGDLQKYLKSTIEEAEARVILRQLLEGLHFMHENQFAHRDLKPGNILVLHEGPEWWVKIADFGICKQLEESTALRTRIGTPAYLAPEVRGIYSDDADAEDLDEFSLSVDIWSIGTIAFQMLTGRLAFPDGRQLFNYVVRGSPLNFESMGTEPIDFIKKTMAASPNRRMTSQQALAHSWVQVPWRIVSSDALSDDRGPGIAETPPSIFSARWTTLTDELTPLSEESTPLVEEERRFVLNRDRLPAENPRNRPMHELPLPQRERTSVQTPWDHVFEEAARPQAKTPRDDPRQEIPLPQQERPSVKTPGGDHAIGEAARPPAEDPRNRSMLDMHLPQIQAAKSSRGHDIGAAAAEAAIEAVRKASRPRDKTARAFQLVQEHKIDMRTILFVAFSPNGNQIAVGDLNRTIHVWEADGKGGLKLAYKLEPTADLEHAILGSFTSASFSSDGKRFAVGSASGAILIYAAEAQGKKLRLAQELQGRGSTVIFVVWTPEGKSLTSGDVDGNITTWVNNSHGALKLYQDLYDTYSRLLTCSTTTNYIVSMRGDDVLVWKLRRSKHEVIQRLRNLDHRIRSAFFSFDEKQLFLCSLDEILVWKTDIQGKLQLVQELRDVVLSANVLAATISFDGRLIAGVINGNIRIWRRDVVSGGQ